MANLYTLQPNLTEEEFARGLDQQQTAGLSQLGMSPLEFARHLESLAHEIVAAVQDNPRRDPFLLAAAIEHYLTPAIMIEAIPVLGALGLEEDIRNTVILGIVLGYHAGKEDWVALSKATATAQ